MPIYKAPLVDISFVLENLLKSDKLTILQGYEEATTSVVAQILNEGSKICEEVLFPLNQTGDKEGCSYNAGEVTTPKGFKEAYNTYIDGGWMGLACDPEYGGMGLPELVNFSLEEMVCSANLSLGMYPGLSRGAYNALKLHANDELKNTYLPKLVSGEWSGTMCLTEPHSGTDLGLIRTKAEPNDDGSWNITGTKIFISSGDHDLTDNIIHLVLARATGARSGTKGISLFVVPKYVQDINTFEYKRGNNVTCGSIEHKMGIHGNSTCVMNFDGSRGWLVGELHKGMRAMFTMMNAARLAVGIQGLGLAEVAYQNSVAYVKERLQGRSLTGAKYPEKYADPLIVHPDVRRMLMTMKSYIEGCRALSYSVGMAIDFHDRHPDPKIREENGNYVELMTPIVKSFLTDMAFEVTNLAVQIHGGSGYITETGIEQYVRDARITQIYEGTNSIQALDLVGRKLPQNMGKLLRCFFVPTVSEIEMFKENPCMMEMTGQFEKSFGRLQTATTTIAFKGLSDPNEAAAVASEYLKMFGLVAVGLMWLRMVRCIDVDHPLYKSKRTTAQFYMSKILPQTSSLLSSIMAGAKPVMALDEELF